MEFDQVVYGEIPTDVDVCFRCGYEIDHECLEVTSGTMSAYFHVGCFNGGPMFNKESGWKTIKYVLNEGDK